MGKVVDKLCELLGVDAIHTSPYRPQLNGVVERFHGTIKPMTEKASANSVDWAFFFFCPWPCLPSGKWQTGLLDFLPMN